jgi:hypothetical protein
LVVCGLVAWTGSRLVQTLDFAVQSLAVLTVAVERISAQVESHQGWLSGHENRIQHLERRRGTRE